MRLHIKAFFFNAKMDYLPYYKSFVLDVDEQDTIEKICSFIKKKDFNFDYPKKEYFYVKINGKVVNSLAKAKMIIDEFGTEIVMEPVSKYRAVDDMVIDDRDFFESFKLIEPFADEKDFQYFKSLYDVHYASSAFEYSLDYIGDAVLVTAYSMIKKGNENKEEILKAISEGVSGLWDSEYENNVFLGKDYSSDIEELKNMAKKPTVGILENICYKFSKKVEIPTLESLKDINVALYFADEDVKSRLKEFGANIVEFSKSKKLAGQTLLEVNPKMAFKKGGAVLLDAMDSAAEILICAKDEDAKYFRENFGNFEKVAGREIYLEIISFNELKSMIENKKEEV